MWGQTSLNIHNVCHICLQLHVHCLHYPPQTAVPFGPLVKHMILQQVLCVILPIKLGLGNNQIDQQDLIIIDDMYWMKRAMKPNMVMVNVCVIDRIGDILSVGHSDFVGRPFVDD